MPDLLGDRDYALLEVLIDKQPNCAALSAYLGARVGEGSDPRALIETLEMLTATQLDLFWSKARDLASHCVQQLGLTDDSDEEGHERAIDTPVWAAGVGTLSKIAALVMMFCESSKSRPKSLLMTLVTLHDVLTLLNCDDSNESCLQSTISKVCEAWWTQNETGRELVVTQLIAYLLLCAVENDETDVFVKRLYVIKSAFQLLDFDDDSIESIRGLLLRCFAHPRFLKVAEGRRFLSFSFMFHEDVQELAIEVMKPQLVSGNSSVAAAYGDVLLRAWRETESSPTLRQHFEDLLQSLVHNAIHAQNSRYFQGLRECLRVFHDSKKFKEVDTLLLRLYGPILWRSLRCANALVRVQAATLFFDVFPIQDGNNVLSTNADNDNLLQRQFDLLKSLLEDGDHRVRAVAASGCCRVLCDFWEAVPTAITHQLLSFIAGKLGSDASSSIVRLSVVYGLRELLNNPRSHATMKSILPAISNMLHDYSDKVRAGYVKILIKVKSIRGFRFYDIVPIDVLLRRLVIDQAKPVVREAITELLLNSFYPQNRSDCSSSSALGPIQTQRCLSFLAENESAALAFYSCFYKFTSVGSAVKMCVLLLGVLEEALSNSGLVSCLASELDSADVSAEIHAPQMSRILSDKSIKLLRCAKRRREQESQKFIAVSTGITLSGNILRSILTAVRVIVSSISSKIKQENHRPSREMLVSYFSVEKMTEILPNILKWAEEVERYAILNATYFFQMAAEVMSVHAIPAIGAASLSENSITQFESFAVSSITTLVEFNAECSKNKGAVDIVQIAPMAHAIISLVCRLNCEDILLSLIPAVEAVADFGYGPNASEWFPTAKMSHSKIEVFPVDFLTIFSAILNSCDIFVQTGLRKRVVTDKDIKISFFGLFRRLQEMTVGDNSTIDHIFLEIIHLGSIYTSLVYVSGKIHDDMIINALSEWIFIDLTKDFISAAATGNKNKMVLYASLIRAAVLPLMELIICPDAVDTIAKHVCSWVQLLSTLDTSSGAEWELLYVFLNICTRMCCLFSQAEVSYDNCTSAQSAWKGSLMFLLQFMHQFDLVCSAGLVASDFSTIRAQCVSTLSSMLQFLASRPKLNTIYISVLCMLIGGAANTIQSVGDNNIPIAIQIFCSKRRFCNVTREIIEKAHEACDYSCFMYGPESSLETDIFPANALFQMLSND